MSAFHNRWQCTIGTHHAYIITSCSQQLRLRQLQPSLFTILPGTSLEAQNTVRTKHVRTLSSVLVPLAVLVRPCPGPWPRRRPAPASAVALSNIVQRRGCTIPTVDVRGHRALSSRLDSCQHSSQPVNQSTSQPARTHAPRRAAAY